MGKEGGISAAYLSLGQMNDEGDKLFMKGQYAGAEEMFRYFSSINETKSC